MTDAMTTDPADPFEPAARRPEGGRGTTVASIVDFMRRGILSGLFAPGQRLIEADITRDLGVSRGPVREAFRQLSADGLVETISNRGTIVRRFSPREVTELFEIRTALEQVAARGAARAIGLADHRERMEEIAARLARDHSTYSRDDFFDENRLVHETIADVSGNRQLAALIRQMQMPLIVFRLNRELTREISFAAVAEHLAIAAAILAGDEAGAEEAMRRHLQTSILRVPEPDGGTTPTGRRRSARSKA